MMDPAKFVHDAVHILEVNDAGCCLFHCDRSALIDLDMLQLIASPDFRGLASLRLKLMREMRTLPNIKYKFIRCDGTRFWATVTTTLRADCHFETVLTYECEE
jgi:PAS domain S-box-containing protein